MTTMPVTAGRRRTVLMVVATGRCLRRKEGSRDIVVSVVWSFPGGGTGVLTGALPPAGGGVGAPPR